MKRLHKSKAAWFALAILIVFTVAYAVYRLRRPDLFITLPNGDQYELAGLNYGTNLAPPSLLWRLARHLPPPLAKLEAKAFGPQVSLDPSLEYMPLMEPRLILWLKQTRTNANTPLFSSITVRLADEHGIEAGIPLDGSIDFRAGFGWALGEFATVPRRSRTLRFNFYTYRAGTPISLGSATLRNPLYRTYPQWQPADSAKSSKMDGPVGIWLEDFSTNYIESNGMFALPGGWPAMPALGGRYASRRTLIAYVIFKEITPTNTAEDWALVSNRLSDATGNDVTLFPSGEYLVPTGNYPGAPFEMATYWMSVPPRFENMPKYPIQLSEGIFWPGENAWRLQFDLKRTNGFASNEIVTFTNVPIPAFRATNFLPVTVTNGATKVRLASLVRDPLLASGVTSALGNSIRIFIVLPDQTAGVTADIIGVATPFGTPLRVVGFENSLEPIFNSLPTNATTMDITVAVQKLRTVEFYVKPPTPQ